MKRKIISLTLCFCILATSLCGCNAQNVQTDTTTVSTTAAEVEEATTPAPITQENDVETTEKTTEKETETKTETESETQTVAEPQTQPVTESQTQPVTSETPVSTTKPTVTTTTEETTVKTTQEKIEPIAPVEFHKVIEAENATLNGSLSIGNAGGEKVVENFDSDNDSLEFSVDFPADGLYKFVIRSSGIGSDKVNNFLIDGAAVGTFNSIKDKMSDYALENILVTKGSHKIKITKSWGWMQLDKITIEASAGIDESIFDTPTQLINKNATAETKALFNYLTECYGNVTLSGQVYGGGSAGDELEVIYKTTGKYPAIIGLDMMDYTPSRAALGASSRDVDKAIEYSNKGGIVTFCWHWNAPTSYLYSGNDNDNGNPRWWGGFYTRNSAFDISKVMNGQDNAGKALLDKDIEAIAKQLKRLEEKGIPVLWRPLHEASGGWFWWGAKGPDAYKKLWVYLYDKLTNTYGCNNLIWVWNGQNKDWYPGDKYVDIVGEDIYPGNRVYSPQTPKFCEVVDYPGENKIVALTENGCLFDIDLAYATGTKWAWFCTWCGDFVMKNRQYSEAFTEKSVLKKVYNSEYVITLDELPKF